MNTSKTFADRLQIVLDESGLSKSTLALSLDVSPATITGWLKGKGPTLDNLVRLSQLLNISLCWLVNGVGPMRLHGPMHVSRDEEELIMQLRFFPEEVVDHLFIFLAAVTNAESDYDLVNRARASKVLSSVGLAMAILDSHHIVRDINSEYLKLLNIEPAKKVNVVGSSLLDWVLPEQRGQLIMRTQDAVRTGHLECFRCDHIRFDDANTAPVILSGAHQGNADTGFLLLTAFILPE